MSHEDIRYKVVSRLREAILQAINNLRLNKPQIYSGLRKSLEEYEKLISHKEDIPLIIKNEKIIKVGIPDIEVFGGRILIEVKVKPSEFGDGFEQLSRYASFYPYANYAVLTNLDIWENFKVERGKLVKAKIDLDHMVEDVLSKDVKIPLSTERVRDLFKPIVLLEGELSQIFVTYKMMDDALYEAYQNIMKRLYEKASEAEIENLFIKHTLMQMIVSSCLTISSRRDTQATRACSGADLDAEIVLPYLKWWESLRGISNADSEFLSSMAESIYSKARLLDWGSGNEADIFRELYEILIDAETRRKIGEYYTPLWLAEYMIDKLSTNVSGLKGKKILDPFCGSGTFLVAAFYKKVLEGEKPDEAIKEVIGFDINPLAVSIARAELMIAHQSRQGGTATPLIFNTDSANLLLHRQIEQKSSIFLSELREIEKKIEYVSSPIFATTEIDFSEILSIEMILRNCFKETAKARDLKRNLKLRLDELKAVKWNGILTPLIVNTLVKEKNIDAISNLIEKYGNGVWAVSITSLFAPHIIRKAKVDIIVTNPPWAQLTEPKGFYGDLLREKAKEILKDQEKSGQILAGADISSILLHGSIRIANYEAVFLMPDEVVYTKDSHYGLGKILTYRVTKDHSGKVIQIGFDAFQHGRLPSIVFLKKKKGGMLCYFMNVEWKGDYSKALHLSAVTCTIRKEENYSTYIEKVAAYTKISSEAIRENLRVDSVNPKGNYIMGLFGGTKKAGAKEYAGLTFSVIAEDTTTKQYSIKLHNLDNQTKIQEFFLNPYWKKLVYAWDTFPFYISGIHNVLLSSEGKEKLTGFLKRQILESAPKGDKEKVEILIDELRQPEKLERLKKGKYYVVYRGRRTFASCVFAPRDIRKLSENYKYPIVLDDNCSSIVTRNQPIAYYYSSVLNYLAWKVNENKGVFHRAQYFRPLIAILQADLEWKETKWQLEVARIGKRLHQLSPKAFENFIKKGILIQKCFKRLETYDGTEELFKELIEIVNQNTDKKRLHKSLEYVCKLQT